LGLGCVAVESPGTRLAQLRAQENDQQPANDVPVLDVGALRFEGVAPRNVLMISIDTLRQDHLDPYGDRQLTPNLGRYLTEGVHAPDTMQCSNWTMASVSCTLLGRDPVEHGFLPRLESQREVAYPDGTRFLAVELAEAGFRTVLSSRNGFFSDRVHNDQGYDTVLGGLPNAAAQLAGTLAFVQEQEDGTPWFAHVHVVEPHAPYDAVEFEVGRDALAPIDYDLADGADMVRLRADLPSMSDEDAALVQAHVRLAYDAEVRSVDDQIARALSGWDEAGYLDDTLVVFWSDHGEQLWEHGHFTHAYDLNYGENNALFAVWAKNLVPGVWTGPVSAQDIAPTVLTVLDQAVPEEMTGFSIGLAPADRVRRAVSVARGEGHNSLRRGDLKLIATWSGQRSLFDKSLDPGETTDRFDPTNPEHMELWDQLAAYVADTQRMAPDVDVDWASLERAGD
jgi:arylsulfatase A-like enzyme